MRDILRYYRTILPIHHMYSVLLVGSFLLILHPYCHHSIRHGELHLYYSSSSKLAVFVLLLFVRNIHYYYRTRTPNHYIFARLRFWTYPASLLPSHRHSIDHILQDRRRSNSSILNYLQAE